MENKNKNKNNLFLKLVVRNISKRNVIVFIRRIPTRAQRKGKNF